MKTKKSTTDTPETSAKHIIIRFTAYTVALFALTLSLPILIEHGDIVIFKEDGPIEWFQFGVLVATSAILLFSSWYLANFRQIFLLMGCVAVFAAIRELDRFLEQAIPWIGWKFGFIVLFCAVALACTKRTLVKRQIPPLLATSAFGILWAGFLVAVPVGQLLGHGPFLQLVMGDDYNRHYKRVIEESLETIGYLLVLIGSLESVLQLRNAASEPSRPTLSHADNLDRSSRTFVDTNAPTA
jgi:hypothetical protein